MILIGLLQFKLYCDSVNFIDAPFLFLNAAFAQNTICNRNTLAQVYARSSDCFSHLTWAWILTVSLFAFQLIIFCDAYQFKVAINGVHTLEYKHRFKQLEKINIVEVTGDIHLLDVRSW